MKTTPRENLPWIAQPVFLIGSIALFLVGYGLVLAYVPEVRPGLIHIAIGGCLGVIGGSLFRIPMIAHIKDLMVVMEQSPWMGKASVFWAPPMKSTYRNTAWFIPIIFSSFLICILLIQGADSRGWLHVAEGRDAVNDSLPRCMVLFLTAFGTTLQAHLLVWVRRWLQSS